MYKTVIQCLLVFLQGFLVKLVARQLIVNFLTMVKYCIIVRLIVQIG